MLCFVPRRRKRVYDCDAPARCRVRISAREFSSVFGRPDVRAIQSKKPPRESFDRLQSLTQGRGSKSPAYADYSHWVTLNERTGTKLVLCTIAHTHRFLSRRDLTVSDAATTGRMNRTSPYVVAAACLCLAAGGACRHPFADRLRNVVSLPRHRENRPAQALMPPLRRMNCARGSESGLYAAAYRRARLHLLRVRLSALAGSAVHRMMAANGPSRSDTSNRCKRYDHQTIHHWRASGRRFRHRQHGCSGSRQGSGRTHHPDGRDGDRRSRRGLPARRRPRGR
jgi:hypothetical protein